MTTDLPTDLRNTGPSLLRYWAKTGKERLGGDAEPTYHPLGAPEKDRPEDAFPWLAPAGGEAVQVAWCGSRVRV